MPTFAFLENDIVTRMVTQPESPGGAAWRPASEGCVIGALWDGAGFTEAPRHPDRGASLAAAVAVVRQASDAVLAAAAENASAVEMATWPGKLAAAEAWDGGDTSAVIKARLDAVGIPRGLDHDSAAALILAKAGAFRAAAAAVEAVRVAALADLAAVDEGQALKPYIAALDAVLAELDWPS